MTMVGNGWPKAGQGQALSAMVGHGRAMVGHGRAWSAMGGSGWPWSAMFGLCRSWLAIVGYGQSWPAIDQPWFAETHCFGPPSC